MSIIQEPMLEPLDVIVEKFDKGRKFNLRFIEDVSDRQLIKYMAKRDGQFFAAMVEDGYAKKDGLMLTTLEFARNRLGKNLDGVYHAYVSYREII